MHADTAARKAALVRNYFSRRSYFGFLSLSLSGSVIFDQINADVLFRRVNYLYLATFTCPIVFGFFFFFLFFNFFGLFVPLFLR